MVIFRVSGRVGQGFVLLADLRQVVVGRLHGRHYGRVAAKAMERPLARMAPTLPKWPIPPNGD